MHTPTTQQAAALPDQTRELHLASRPTGMPKVENFSLVTQTLPALKEGQVLIKNTWMSVDPYMRGRMVDRKSYVPPFQLNQVLEGGAIGEIIASRHSDFPVGTKVSSMLGWREHAVSNTEGLTALPDTVLDDSHFLGVLGMPGMTAWTGLTRIGNLQAGETLFVSAASGAVGSVACQLGKLMGARVVASVGSDEKAQLLQSYGVDAIINYKTCGDLTQALAAAAPEGIDVYFENVGGAHLEAALSIMNDHGRIAACGMISQYNDTEPTPGPNNLAFIVMKKLKMQGFIVFEHWSHYPEFAEKMAAWLAEGKVKTEQTVYSGLTQAPDAFIGLFEGKNRGKMLVKLA